MALLDAGSLGEKRRIPGPRTLDASFAPEGQRLATLTDHAIVLWDVDTAMPLRQFASGDTKPVFAPDGKRIAWGGRNGLVRIYDISDLKKGNLFALVCGRLKSGSLGDIARKFGIHVSETGFAPALLRRRRIRHATSVRLSARGPSRGNRVG